MTHSVYIMAAYSLTFACFIALLIRSVILYHHQRKQVDFLAKMLEDVTRNS